MKEKTKTERLEARTTTKDKQMIARAAEIKGMSTSQFILTVTKAQAMTVISESEHILQTQKDKELFVNALLNAPEPSEELKNAFRDFRKKYTTVSQEKDVDD